MFGASVRRIGFLGLDASLHQQKRKFNIPKTNNLIAKALAHRPKPTRKGSSPNHHFSGDKLFVQGPNSGRQKFVCKKSHATAWKTMDYSMDLASNLIVIHKKHLHLLNCSSPLFFSLCDSLQNSLFERNLQNKYVHCESWAPAPAFNNQHNKAPLNTPLKGHHLAKTQV